MRNRTSQQKRKRESGTRKTNIPRLAFLLASLLIAVTSASLAFVGYVASEASRQQAIQNERRLFENTLEDRIRQVVREALPIARSDESVSKIVRSFDVAYVRAALGKLWSGHGHNRSFLVNSDHQVLAETFDGYTHISRHPLSDTPALEPLMAAAENLFSKNRVRTPGGYSHKNIQGLDLHAYAVTGLILYNNKPAIAGAVPLMPDLEKVQLPDDRTVYLITVRFIDPSFIRQLNSQLALNGLTFVPGMEAPSDGANLFLTGIGGVPLGSFLWQSASQNESIWPTVIPVILMLGAALAVLALLIAWRIGRLTNSLQASEQQSRYLAMHDTLTGLANRLHFNRLLASAIKGLPARPFAVLHCDLDHFKAVNDTHGHTAGDIVIQEVARRMKEIIGDGGVVSRVGGDEFVILFRKTVARAKLEALAGALIQAVQLKIALTDETFVRVGLSVGISVARSSDQTPELLFAQADHALYASKEAGRGRLTFSEPAKGDELRGDELAAAVLMRAAGKRGEAKVKPKTAESVLTVRPPAPPQEVPPAEDDPGPPEKQKISRDAA